MTPRYPLAFIPDNDWPNLPQGLRAIRVGDGALVYTTHGVMRGGRKAMLKQAAKRQAQLEALMAAGTVLPFRTGARLLPEHAGPFLAANRPLIETLHARLADLNQHQLTVRWDTSSVLARFRTTPELDPIFQSGHVRADRLEGALARLAQRLRTDMEAMIAPLTHEILLLPCAEDMILNLVLLAPRDAAMAIDGALEEIDSIWPEGLRIRLVGPAPAASFALLDINTVGPADLAKAASQLALRNPYTKSSVQHARQAMLRARPEQAETTKSAADILLAHLRAGVDRFPMCHVLREDTAHPITPHQAVA